MQSLCFSRRLTQLSTELNCQLVAKRFGGGGGRPGGKPTFNWREKMTLRLNTKKQKKITLQPFGDFDYIKKDLGEDDFLITLKGEGKTTLSPEEINKLFKKEVNTTKVIDRTMLFGSQKTAGMLPHKHGKKQPFSHRRIFGHKSAETQQ